MKSNINPKSNLPFRPLNLNMTEYDDNSMSSYCTLDKTVTIQLLYDTLNQPDLMQWELGESAVALGVGGSGRLCKVMRPIIMNQTYSDCIRYVQL